MHTMILSLLLALIYSGCATTLYSHPTKPAEDFEKDKYDCELTAAQYAANMGAPGNPFTIARETKRCIEVKHGWTVCKDCQALKK